MFNKLIDTIVVTSMNLVKSSPIKFKNTIYTRNEPFFSVPLEYFNLYHFDGFI